MKTQGVHRLALACAAALACGAVAAAGLKIQMPPETAALKVAPGSELAAGQCGTCHSADYVSTQPRDKPFAFWKAEVEKMRKVYGAPIADENITPLAEYLTKAYGKEQSK